MFFDPGMHVTQNQDMHTNVLMSSSNYNPITVKTHIQIHIFSDFFSICPHTSTWSLHRLFRLINMCDLYALRAQPCWGLYHVPLCWTFQCWPRAFDAQPDRVLLSIYLFWICLCIQFKWEGELAMHIRLPSRHASLKYSLLQAIHQEFIFFFFNSKGMQGCMSIHSFTVLWMIKKITHNLHFSFFCQIKPNHFHCS